MYKRNTCVRMHTHQLPFKHQLVILSKYSFLSKLLLIVWKSGFEGGVDQIHPNFTTPEKNHNPEKKDDGLHSEVPERKWKSPTN